MAQLLADMAQSLPDYWDPISPEPFLASAPSSNAMEVLSLFDFLPFSEMDMDMDMDSQGQDADGTGLAAAGQASHGQRRSSPPENMLALRLQHDDASRPPDALAPSSPALSVFPFADLSVDQVPDPSNSFTLEEDGGGNMVVVSPGTLQNHVDAHHDPRNGLFPPTPIQSAPDMATATDDASTSAASTTATLAPPADASLPADLISHNALSNDLLPPLDAPTDLQGLDMAPEFIDFPQSVADERLTAFARLRFDDGSYYMHTYQIMLGRNVELAKRDQHRLAKTNQTRADMHSQTAVEEPNGRRSKKRKRDRRAARSVISEKGGIVNAPIAAMPMEYQQRRQSNASHSRSSASHPNGESGEEKPAERASQNELMQAFPEAPTRIEGHVTENPLDCPIVPIHPQHLIARSGNQGPKGISRNHAKIFYDFELGNFCIEVFGANGLYHENEFIQRGEVVALDHGDRLLIGAVNIQFYLPDIALTEDQRHRQESGSRPMSYTFENGHGQQETDEQESSDSEARSMNPAHMYIYPKEIETDSDEDDIGDYEEPAPSVRKKQKEKYSSKQNGNQTLKLKINPPPSQPTPKEIKKTHKRKHRDVTPEEAPIKKIKTKSKEPVREPTKEPKSSKEPKETKEPKEKGKMPAKTPSKTMTKEETTVHEPAKEAPVREKPVPNDSPPLLRKPYESELEAGDIDGLITEDMARQHNLPASLVGHVVEKRKGPGRPPKDGVMSKRQRSQLIREAKEIEKARAAGIDPADIPALTLKPKITKRKLSNVGDGEDDDVLESTEQGDGTLPGDKKQVKLIKPPRTPSPELRVEDYSEDQLQRPSANYVVLIHEAISSSSTGQMNLQQIYNYIEKNYPWYKFKTTTSGWQSSVRHNLGQHEAFTKGDKEGKGFNWRINPEVSIEKERRKRQVSPPINHAQRQLYNQPPTGYSPYPQTGYPYHPGMPQAMPPAASSPITHQPRLPPSMARDGNTAAPTAPQGQSHASPYASPWGNASATGGPPATNHSRPYPQLNSQTPPVNVAAASSGQYGVLLPTTAPQAYNGPPMVTSYSGQYGSSPYASAPPRPYSTVPLPGQLPTAHPLSPYPSASSHLPQSASSHKQGTPSEDSTLLPSGRYPIHTRPELIRQLEAFRGVYLKERREDGEETKIDNAIRACLDTTVPEATLTPSEQSLLMYLRGVYHIAKLLPDTFAAKQSITAGATAAIAANIAANSPAVQHSQVAQQSMPSTLTPSGESTPQGSVPNVTAMPSVPPPSSAPVHPLSNSHRPSVEPLTPVPGSPALPDNTPLKRTITELEPDSHSATEDVIKLESDEPESKLQ